MDAEAERVHGSSTETGTATEEEEEEDAIKSWEEERRASGILCLRRKSGRVESSRVGSGAVRCGTVRVKPNQSGQSPPFQSTRHYQSGQVWWSVCWRVAASGAHWWLVEFGRSGCGLMARFRQGHGVHSTVGTTWDSACGLWRVKVQR